jgi:hypothetical protein
MHRTADRFRTLSFRAAATIAVAAFGVAVVLFAAAHWLGTWPGWADGWPGVSRHTAMAAVTTVLTQGSAAAAATATLVLPFHYWERWSKQPYSGWRALCFATVLQVAGLVWNAPATYESIREAAARTWP